MTKNITFLGIETSCDETAAAVIRENDEGTADILSNVVSSQIEEHKKFGGVVPELAARAHLENIEYIIDTALKESGTTINKIDGVAATAGPGLIVCLTVGLNIGKSTSLTPYITLSISVVRSASALKFPVPPNNHRCPVESPTPASIEKKVYLLLSELAFNVNNVV